MGRDLDVHELSTGIRSDRRSRLTFDDRREPPRRVPQLADTSEGDLLAQSPRDFTSVDAVDPVEHLADDLNERR